MNSCLRTAQNNLCVQSVNLKESKIFVRDDVDLEALDRNETIAQSFRLVDRVREISLTDPESEDDIWEYHFIYSVGVRLVFSNEKEEATKEGYIPILEIVGIFDAGYLSKSQLKKDELDAFSADNVGYHVWPFWREYVQSTSARIGFSPSFEVPMYIIPRRDKESESD